MQTDDDISLKPGIISGSPLTTIWSLTHGVDTPLRTLSRCDSRLLLTRDLPDLFKSGCRLLVYCLLVLSLVSISFFLFFFNDITVQSWWVSFFSLFLFYSVADELKRSRCLASVIFLKSNSHLKDFKKLNAKRNKIFKPF